MPIRAPAHPQSEFRTDLQGAVESLVAHLQPVEVAGCWFGGGRSEATTLPFTPLPAAFGSQLVSAAPSISAPGAAGIGGGGLPGAIRSCSLMALARLEQQVERYDRYNRDTPWHGLRAGQALSAVSGYHRWAQDLHAWVVRDSLGCELLFIIQGKICLSYFCRSRCFSRQANRRQMAWEIGSCDHVGACGGDYAGWPELGSAARQREQ